MNAAKAKTLITSIKAEDAPIGAPLWPSSTPDKYTLAAVAVIREAAGSRVVWTYRDGTVSNWAAGEIVPVHIEA